MLPEAEEALHRAVTASRLVTSLADGTERVDWGETGVVTAGSRGLVTVRDPDDGATRRTIRAHAGTVTDVAVTPDGSTLATSGRDGALRVWDAEGSPRWEALGGGPARGISLSADGARIAAAWTSPAEVQVFDVSSGARVARFRGVDATETALNLDGSSIAIVTASRKGKVLDVASGQELIPRLDPDHGVDRIAWSPDDRYLATVGFAASADIWVAETGAFLATGPSHTGSVTSIAWSPDATRVVSGAEDGYVKVWHPIGGGSDVISLPPIATPRPITDVAVSADGSRVIASTGAGGPMHVSDIGVDGDAEWVNLPSIEAIGHVAFVSSTQLIAPAPDGTLVLWDAGTTRPCGRSAEHRISRTST